MIDIYDLIPSDRWITRRELCNLTGWSDRRVRDEISKLRRDPETVVISSSSGKGYKRPSSVEDLEMCRNEYRSRAKEELEIADVFDKAIREFEKRGKSEQLWFDFREYTGGNSK